MSSEEKIKQYLSLIDNEINTLNTYQDVPLFYDPIHYVLQLPGKKIRPLMLMLSCGMAGGKIEDARFAAAAVELLHNFTLVHDDIMDNDETRRGMPSVHIKWDTNTAILAGDGLLGFSFQKLLQSPVTNRDILAEKFTEAMIVICEGQGLDKMFEESETITDVQYLDMIERKTAALIRLSCQLGALVAAADKQHVNHLYNFGHNLGMAFQVQDDILDITADQSKLGKKVGSDFEMHKQTILTIMLRQKIGLKKFKSLNLQDYKLALKNEDILEKVMAISADYFQNAEKSLAYFADSEYKQIMLKLICQIKERSY